MPSSFCIQNCQMALDISLRLQWDSNTCHCESSKFIISANHFTSIFYQTVVPTASDKAWHSSTALVSQIALAWIAQTSTGPFTHAIFLCDFCRGLQCNFYRKCKLAAISLRFRVRCLLQFPPNRSQVTSSCIKFRTCSKHVPYCGDKSYRNRTEIAPSLHARFNDATWARACLKWPYESASEMQLNEIKLD